MSATGKLGNPGVVGLAGFGLTTLLLQFHNLGLCGTSAVFVCAVFFGGGAQLIAGFQEFKCGNNFGYCAFTAYGAFWLALATLFVLMDVKAGGATWVGKNLTVTGTEVGMFLLTFTLFTTIMWIIALRIHGMMAFTFTTLMIGFIGLDLRFLAGNEMAGHIAHWDLIVCALSAWYMMAHVLCLDIFGYDVLPVGKPWISPSPKLSAAKA